MTVVDTPELLTPEMMAATHTVWIDQDLVLGDGLTTEIAPDSFYLGVDGLERVRFGRVVGYAEGMAATLPIVPRLLSRVVEAANEDPSEAVFVELIVPGESTEMHWKRFFEKQVRAVGQFATFALDQQNIESDIARERFYNLANIIGKEPKPPKDTSASDLDNFDVLSYLGIEVTPTTRKVVSDCILDLYPESGKKPSRATTKAASQKIKRLLDPVL